MRAADDDSAAVRAPGRERPYATIITKLSTKAACRSLKIADIIGQTSPNPIASIAMAGGQTGAEQRVVEPGHGELPDGVDDLPNVMTGQRPQQAAARDAGHRLCRSPACRPRRSLAGTGDAPRRYLALSGSLWNCLRASTHGAMHRECARNRTTRPA
nr:hypothetical protein [Burkholderia diffusa]